MNTGQSPDRTGCRNGTWPGRATTRRRPLCRPSRHCRLTISVPPDSTCHPGGPHGHAARPRTPRPNDRGRTAARRLPRGTVPGPRLRNGGPSRGRRVLVRAVRTDRRGARERELRKRDRAGLPGREPICRRRFLPGRRIDEPEHRALGCRDRLDRAAADGSGRGDLRHQGHDDLRRRTRRGRGLRLGLRHEEHRTLGRVDVAAAVGRAERTGERACDLRRGPGRGWQFHERGRGAGQLHRPLGTARRGAPSAAGSRPTSRR
jgi:hypothetical protein